MAAIDLKIPFGLAPDGRMVSVDEVFRGLNCECVCAQCGASLVAAKGEIIRHHFRHHSPSSTCTYGPETALHQYAKQVICEQMRLGLPDGDLGPILSAKPEVMIGGVNGVKPDVVVEFQKEVVAVEIYVKHRVPRDKIDKYANQELAAIEIDLSKYPFADRTDEYWHEIILYAASRYWLFPPRYIREENERKRLHEIEQRKIAQEKARQEYERRSQERARLEQELAEFQARQTQKAIDAEYHRAIQASINAEQRARAALEHEQQRLVFEERRRVNAELREARRRRRIAELAPPSLQDMVTIHGGYHLIPPEAWNQYENDVSNWKTFIRSGDKYQKW
jgi:hypothetical protein